MTYRELQEQMRERQRECVRIASNLRMRGWDADVKFVNRHWLNCKRWDNGLLALGYLARRTGLRRINRGK